MASTCHAYPSIFRTDRALVKMMWTVLLVIGVFCCTVLIVISILEFFSYQTTTNIQIMYESVLELPAATVCLLSQNTVSYRDKLNFYFKDLPLKSCVQQRGQGVSEKGAEQGE